MIEHLKSDEIVRKCGGRFKLTALVQRRWHQLAIEGCIQYPRSGSLRLLNTLLKVNDLLCSLSASEIDCLHHYAIYCAITFELAFVLKLADQKGVNFAED